jgi:hypothetical protein
MPFPYSPGVRALLREFQDKGWAFKPPTTVFGRMDQMLGFGHAPDA